ncbi:hypothetical protein [Aureimonas jatrophae]|uniref:Uncharacterized protein n=1 Tax=Aureimonas jatrophae TaxID=1166073 RepID=A0A1H0ITU3_9HYPH|nr:hypothetical protein [Aureimonas jatrophae]MBB3952355.1 hypothetical protein [Aureimonas jatrophae]SDO34753.1 hypothetical protein SAMN05192530_105332 [Aureimonas jatrophae]
MDGLSSWDRFEAIARPLLSAAPGDYLASIQQNLVRDGVVSAVAYRDAPALFDHLVGVSQFQGISDRNAAAFTSKHGIVSWDDIAASIQAGPSCSRLRGFWSFDRCGYRKATATCMEPRHIVGCPLPEHPARKGSLIQAAYALFFFLRDVCAGDLVGWIDQRLAEADPGRGASDRAVRMGAALLDPLRGITGIGSKVWSMALADLLLAADLNRERWVATGAGMVVIDTLLHNHLHRTGTLRRFMAEHPYGRCYAPAGCADLIRGLAQRIDAREFNPDFPACFPRFVQFAIWRLASSAELNICNGLRIDDRARCENTTCPVFQDCDRVALHDHMTPSSSRGAPPAL